VPPPRTCADTDADGTVDNFSCASHAKDLDAEPAAVTCSADACTDTECCTVVPPPSMPSVVYKSASTSGADRIAAVAPTLGALLVLALL
jgi:hypothetical protein